MGRDITQIEKIKEDLEKAKQLSDMAIKTSQIGIWDFDLIKDTSTRNLRHDQIFGYNKPLSKWGIKIFFMHVIPEDRIRIKAAFDTAMKTGRLTFECGIIWPNWSTHWISMRGKLIQDKAGKSKRLFGTIIDLTVQKKAAENIKKRAEELEKMNKIMIGRELKMIELKKEIAALKEGGAKVT